MEGADGIADGSVTLADASAGNPMKAKPQVAEKGHDGAENPSGGVATAEGATTESQKPLRKETKEERELKRKQKEDEREQKRKRDEEERDRKRKKKEEAEAKKKAEEEEKEQKRKKREEEKEKKRQQEEEEKAKKQREKEERLAKKKHEEEEKARKIKEREDKLEKKRQEEEEKEQRRKEAEQKAKAADKKSVDFMSRFLGKTAVKPATQLQPAVSTAQAPADCAASPSAAAESGEPGPVATLKVNRDASPDAALDDCGDDAASTTNAYGQRPAGPAPASARLSKEAGRPPRLFLPPPDSFFAHSTCARVLEPVNPSAMDRELAVHWKEGPCASADTQPHAWARTGKGEGANNTEAHLGAVPEAEAEGAGDAAASTGGVAAPGSCGSQASAGVAVGTNSATALPEGCGQETLIRHFMSHFRHRRAHQGSSSRIAGAGTCSGRLASERVTGKNWRLRRLPKQVPGNVQSSPLKKQGSSAAGASAKGTKVCPKSKGDGRQGEGEEEEDDDELWSLMGPAARQTSADDDAMDLDAQSSGDAEDGKVQRAPAGKGRKRRVKKLLQFHDNRRPAYYGTHSMSSTAVTARRPLAQEPILEYDIDSDDEWEDIPDDQGESLSDSEGEDEDRREGHAGGDGEGDGEEDEEEDGFVVPDGYLSDDEGVEQGPKAKAPGQEAENGGPQAAKDQATAGGREGAGPSKDVAAAPAETASEAKQRRLQLLEKAVQRALKCGRPVVISALRTPVQLPAEGGGIPCGPGEAGSGALGAGGDAAASSAAASAKAQLEYLQALSIEVITPGVVVTVPPSPVAAVAEDRPLGGPPKKPKYRHQSSIASQLLQQQQQQQLLQQGHVQPGHSTPLKGPLPAPRSGSGRPGSTVSPASMPPQTGLPPLPQPGKEHPHLPGAHLVTNPPAPCTPNTLQAAKQAPGACPVSPVCLDGSPCNHDAASVCKGSGQQAAGKPIQSFFLKRTQGMGPQDNRTVDAGLMPT